MTEFRLVAPPAIVQHVDQHLVELDQRVDRAEGDGIRARWEFGRALLRERVGKQLPVGRLDELAQLTGKSRQELGYRMMFAERFPSEDEVSNAIGNFGSWYLIVNKALGRPKLPAVETPPPPEGTYACLVVDPPWDVRTGPDEFGTSRSNQPLEYPTVAVEAIADTFQIGDWAAPDAHLYLWTINRYVPESYAIAEAWGFDPSTLLVWAKAAHGLGLGGAYTLTTEYVLFARRGTLEPRRRVDSSWFQWPRGRHSRKPDGFYDLVASVSPGPYLDVFGREKRTGWTVWGNEVAA